MKTVIIQEQLLNDLQQKINQFNQTNKPKLKLDLAVFYVSLLNSLPSYNRENNKFNRSVALDSKKLEKYYYKYNWYLDFLIEHQFIEKAKNYGVDIKRCSQYQITEKYYNDKIIYYEIKDQNFNNKFTDTTSSVVKKEFYKKNYCQKYRPHLIKFFDNQLKIDENKANNVLNIIFEKGEILKYISGKQIIKEFATFDWHYSIKQNSDNRLHSSLTRLNKSLRNCLTYDGETLGAVDIKCSQPYFFCGILRAIINKDKDLLERIGVSKVLSDKNINELLNLNINVDEISRFINLVIDGNFYEHFISVLDIRCNEEGKVYRKISKYSTKLKGVKDKSIDYFDVFDSERDLAKDVIMEAFFSTSRSKVHEISAIKKEFPNVFMIMDYIKDHCVEFHKLLSNIESFCLLDYVAVDFHKKYPDAPIFSIHDSIVTTKQYLSILYNHINTELTSIISLQVKLKIDTWVD